MDFSQSIGPMSVRFTYREFRVTIFFFKKAIYDLRFTLLFLDLQCSKSSDLHQVQRNFHWDFFLNLGGIGEENAAPDCDLRMRPALERI